MESGPPGAAHRPGTARAATGTLARGAALAALAGDLRPAAVVEVVPDPRQVPQVRAGAGEQECGTANGKCGLSSQLVCQHGAADGEQAGEDAQAPRTRGRRPGLLLRLTGLFGQLAPPGWNALGVAIS